MSGSLRDEDPTTIVPDWLRWARRLQAVAQAGLHHAEDPFDIERYEEVRGVASRILAEYTDLEQGEVLSVLKAQTGDATPKVDVRGVVFDGDRVLLVREKADEGRWVLPGGWADVGELPSQAVEREVSEESGYEVRAMKLVGCWDREQHHGPGLFSAYKLFFQCDLVAGAPKDSLETADASFFFVDSLPELSRTRVTEGQILRCYEHLRDPSLPTDFD